jgi:hypothetical protein
MQVVPHLSRIGKCLRLLSSDKDHEVIAAARALARVLADTGADFHHLAHIIEQHFQIPEESAPPRLEPWQRQAQWLLDHGELWGSREKSFLENLARSPTPPTRGQRQWMDDIRARRCAA